MDEKQIQQLRRDVAAQKFWYHRIELPGGVVTPGQYPLSVDAYRVSDDLAGKRVLDVGTWDGFWAFEAFKRGASNVVAIDDFSDQTGLDRWKTFDLCRAALGYEMLNVQHLEMSVYDICPKQLGVFDVIFCFGLLYHCKHPLLALEKLASVLAPGGEIYIESAICDDYSPYRGGLGHGHGEALLAEFYPGREYGNNTTNWWVPTKNALAAMVKAAGFTNVTCWKYARPTDVTECRGFVNATAPGTPEQTPIPDGSLGFCQCEDFDLNVAQPPSAVGLPPSVVIRLNLGSGEKPLDGFRNLDKKTGESVFPLAAFANNSVDEIRASHVLEHFPHRETVMVLRDWFRVLRPGGLMKIAVPDFDKIVSVYQSPAASKAPVEGFLMGGQVDQHDVHLAMFNQQKLRDALLAVGLVNIEPWTSELEDCAANPISLNLQGTKPDPAAPKILKVAAAMTTPRLCFSEHMYCAVQALAPHGIPLQRVGGAFWDQAMEKALENCSALGVDAILTLDYDTLFTAEDVGRLIELMTRHPEADAIAGLQTNRHNKFCLFTIAGADGKPASKILLDDFNRDLVQVNSAHFGLTLIRTSALAKMRHPWFFAQPAPDGTWTQPDCIDADVSFWRQWAKVGNSLYVAPKVVIGHCELGVLWPTKILSAYVQDADAWAKTGKPVEAFG